jgi:hypothetical protein
VEVVQNSALIQGQEEKIIRANSGMALSLELEITLPEVVHPAKANEPIENGS